MSGDTTGGFERALQLAVLGAHTDAFDILHFAKMDAALTSARFYQENMLGAKALPDGLALLSYSAALARREGLLLEFGVASGRTINHLACCRPLEKVYGFDSFQGLPETWRTGFEAGAFACAVPLVASNVVLIVGSFRADITRFSPRSPGRTCLALAC